MSDIGRPGPTTGEVDARGSSDRAAIPVSREGYAIDRARGLLHRRYARHALGLPRARSEAQVRTYLGEIWSNCEECWPPAPAPKLARPSRSRKLAQDWKTEMAKPPSQRPIVVGRPDASEPATDGSDDPEFGHLVESDIQFGTEAEAADGVETTPEEPEA